MEKLSIQKSFAGRRVLLTGASGFLGKVWLSMMLARVPEIEKIAVLIRPKGEVSAWDRFEQMVGSSYAFQPWHARYGASLNSYLEEKIEVVSGDISLPGLGIDSKVAEPLFETLDLIVNCAGLVDFEPDLREALATNITGTLNVLEFAKRCRSAALVHVSTCFIVGNHCEGQAPEALQADYSPNGTELDAEAEYEELQSFVATAKLKDSAWVEESGRRAAKYGWPNGYTYSKSLSESLLRRRAGKVKFSIVRPAVVESALQYPFPGWNEGAQTCAPLSYLLGTWLRFFPINTRHVLDVIPVDLVCHAVSIAGAALLAGCAAEVYQCGSSYSNPLPLDRMLELLNLAHRAHSMKSDSPWERIFLSRWDSVAVSEDSRLTPENLRKAVVKATEWLRGIKSQCPESMLEILNQVLLGANKAKWALIKAEKVAQVFRPFIYTTDYRFVCAALEDQEIEEEEFQFAPDKVDWRYYILKVLEPGLRRWCYPVLEGKPVETLPSAGKFRMQPMPVSDPKLLRRAR